jgi:hypothetical protein
MKGQKVKREKGRKANGKQGHSALAHVVAGVATCQLPLQAWVLGTACGSAVFAVSPVAFWGWKAEREDVTSMTPRSALKASFPFPFSPFGF